MQERQIHEDENFSQTLGALDNAQTVEHSSKTQPSPARPPAKKLKLMMDKVPVGQSPSNSPQKTPTKEKKSEWRLLYLLCIHLLPGHLRDVDPTSLQYRFY